MKETGVSIVSSVVTHPERAEFAACEQGVAVVIWNKNGEILLLEQGDHDIRYGRNVGHFNILTETREPGERVKATVERGLGEEMGASLGDFTVMAGTYRETNGVYNKRLGYEFKFRCICLLYEGDPTVSASALFHSTTGEILTYQWVRSDALDSLPVEDGARLVIEYYREVVEIAVQLN